MIFFGTLFQTDLNTHQKHPDHQDAFPLTRKLSLDNIRFATRRSRLESIVRNINDWIGLRENLQETIDFPIKYGAFL